VINGIFVTSRTQLARGLSGKRPADEPTLRD